MLVVARIATVLASAIPALYLMSAIGWVLRGRREFFMDGLVLSAMGLPGIASALDLGRSAGSDRWAWAVAAFLLAVLNAVLLSPLVIAVWPPMAGYLLGSAHLDWPMAGGLFVLSPVRQTLIAKARVGR